MATAEALIKAYDWAVDVGVPTDQLIPGVSPRPAETIYVENESGAAQVDRSVGDHLRVTGVYNPKSPDTHVSYTTAWFDGQRDTESVPTVTSTRIAPDGTERNTVLTGARAARAAEILVARATRALSEAAASVALSAQVELAESISN